MYFFKKERKEHYVSHSYLLRFAVPASIIELILFTASSSNGESLALNSIIKRKIQIIIKVHIFSTCINLPSKDTGYNGHLSNKPSLKRRKTLHTKEWNKNGIRNSCRNKNKQ